MLNLSAVAALTMSLATMSAGLPGPGVVDKVRTPVQESGPSFSADEAAKVLEYWSAPERYFVQPGKPAVRPTSAASRWLYDYNRLPNVPKATRTVWDAWIERDIARCRAAAESVLAGGALPAVVEPPVIDPASTPGIPETQKVAPAIDRLSDPIPADLLARCGMPPSFLEVCVPNEYVVQFDDAAYSYQDRVNVRHRYPSLRADNGVVFPGVPLKKLDDAELDALRTAAGLEEKEMRVFRAVSGLEGGFDSVNTYDTGFVSVGFIQFAARTEGGGSLGLVLLRLKTLDPAVFEETFRRYGIDVSPEGKLRVLSPRTGVELSGAKANAEVIEDKRLIAVFQRAGEKCAGFRKAQLMVAQEIYWPGNRPITVRLPAGLSLTGTVQDVIRSEVGLAILLDRSVHTGNIEPLTAVLNRVAATRKVSTLDELAGYEAEILDQMVHRRDFRADPTLVGGTNRVGTGNLSRGTAPGGRGSRKSGRGSGGKKPTSPIPKGR